MQKPGNSYSKPIDLAQQDPAPSTDSELAPDPRRLALQEWEAVQHLCEALAEAGSANGRSLLPLARVPVGEILL